MAGKKKMTREERLEKKRKAERLRYQRIKNDPEKYAIEKNQKKYKKKKEKGTVKTVNNMTPREHRKAKKLWKEKAAKRRRRLALQNISNAPVTPPSSDVEAPQQEVIENVDKRMEGARKRANRARLARNYLIQKQTQEIKRLKATVQRYQKQLRRTQKTQELTPNTKINQVIETSNADTIKKKLLFGEVVSEQLKKNYGTLCTQQEKKAFKRIISGKLVKKYGVLETEKILKPLSKPKAEIRLIDPKKNTRKTFTMIEKSVKDFLEEDGNSRMCAGKKDYITQKGERKQKRIFMDTLLNFHTQFVKKTNIKISYSLFCKCRPFWIIQPQCVNRDTCLCVLHSNVDLTLQSLYQSKIISVRNHVGLLNTICCDRYDENCLTRNCQTCKNKNLNYKEFPNSDMIQYEKWQSLRQDIVDSKTKKTRKVTKCLKYKHDIYPRDLILAFEDKLDHFLNHERNIVHQYRSMKLKKEALSEEDAIIHVDFSENYLTKYAEEVQSFHFGGSRQQISMHTVVVYTRKPEGELKTICFCTLSENLSHSPPAIWAHLQPVLDSLPENVVNLHFLSDGPVTQYRNKMMFKVLATLLQEFYSKTIYFTWNYHEAGHGKGAPDGVGATCKRTADRAVATGIDISSLTDLATVIKNSCPNINVMVIDNASITEKEKLIRSVDDKFFPGMLRVHQVAGSVFRPNRLLMKSLSCFCNAEDCNHFVIGKLDYSDVKSRSLLNVDDVYGTKSDSDDEPLSLLKLKTNENPRESVTPDILPDTLKNNKHLDDQEPSTSGKVVVNNGNFVLIKLNNKKTEYRYVAMCTGVEEDNEVQVQFCKICDDTGKNFRLDDNDIAYVDWEQIIEHLPTPDIKMKGQRIYYAFRKCINVYEQM